MKRLFALFAIIAIAPAGCTNPYVAEMDAIWAQHEQETRRIQTEYEAASTRIAEESKACLAAISALKVGSGEEITQACLAKKIRSIRQRRDRQHRINGFTGRPLATHIFTSEMLVS
jgi:hypothetical protein